MNALSPPRQPAETPSPRLGALATLPVFFKLGGRSVMLAGGDAWKAELLAATGAIVHVYTPQPSDALLVLAAEKPDTVLIHLRPWSVQDFALMALAVGAISDDAEARAFRCAAKAAGVPVNVVDKPGFCDFSFGSIVNRSPLVIGISTDGAAPVFGQTVRMKIETLLPEGLARWAGAAKLWRERIEPLALAFRLRRAFWEKFSARAFSTPDEKPVEEIRLGILAETLSGDPAGTRGHVSIVGAGPGDPELLTLKAVRVLQSADVVLYDDLVTPAVLGYARREARKIAVGKRAGKASCRQGDISGEILKHALAGKRVVRLKGGDPAVFGRLDEELDACRGAGLTPEIVPGVTTASGAAAALGFSLTRRREAPRLQFITAHGADGGLPPGLNLDAVSDPGVTTCVYMGVRTAGHLAAELLARGLADDTPVRLIINATRPEMRSFLTTLAGIAACIAAEKPDGPALIMIGAAVGEAAPGPSAGVSGIVLEGGKTGTDGCPHAVLLA
jgi:uroporphyrin-III C-methyltransferase / precorrin-2 dehydrogenase / sirohydrochlorin ferrochelatase